MHTTEQQQSEEQLSTPSDAWGAYSWPEWIPTRVRKALVSYWGSGPQAWLDDWEVRGAPLLGTELELRSMGPREAKGRFVHCWGRLGYVVTPDGRARLGWLELALVKGGG